MLIRITSFLLFSFMTTLLAACQTTFYDAGTTPIKISNAVVAGFDRYKQYDHPLFFAVTIDGKYFYSTGCPDSQCASGAETRVISDCEIRYGKECKIFAFERDIVWKGPITYPETRSGQYLLNIRIKEASGTRNSVGSAIFSSDKIKLGLKVWIKGSDCTGIASIETSKWNLSCKNPKKMFHGTFHPATKNKFEGFGRGENGAPVYLVIPNPMPGQQMNTSSSTLPQKSSTGATENAVGLAYCLSGDGSLYITSETYGCNKLGRDKKSVLRQISKEEYNRSFEQKFANKKTSSINKDQSPSKTSIENRLKELKNLIDGGLITHDEAAAKRKEILEGL